MTSFARLDEDAEESDFDLLEARGSRRKARCREVGQHDVQPNLLNRFGDVSNLGNLQYSPIVPWIPFDARREHAHFETLFPNVSYLQASGEKMSNPVPPPLLAWHALRARHWQ